jgi:hypothetical protein
VVAWLFVAVLNVRAVVLRQIMMPGKDEDRGTWELGVPPIIADDTAECNQDDDDKATNGVVDVEAVKML